MQKKQVFTTHQAAKICHVHHTTIINWVNNGKIPSYTTPGGHRRIKRSDLIEFMDKFNIPKSPDLEGYQKRILLIDGDKDFADMVSEALQGEGFLVDIASDGFIAGKKIYTSQPDLVLLDFQMPEMDGFQVLRSIRKDKNTKDLPLIAVTVLRADYDLERMKKYGVKWYMEKPPPIEDIKRLVKMILNFLPHDNEVLKKYALKAL